MCVCLCLCFAEADLDKKVLSRQTAARFLCLCRTLLSPKNPTRLTVTAAFNFPYFPSTQEAVEEGVDFIGNLGVRGLTCHEEEQAQEAAARSDTRQRVGPRQCTYGDNQWYIHW